MHVNCEPRLVWENVVMTGSNCVHRPSDAIDDVTLGSDSDYVTAVGSAGMSVNRV